MEVHHHPELPNRHRKKFGEYIKEGLMIFLAVFLGFVAENIREHLSDSGKEKQYVTSMLKDLQQDSAKLTAVIDGSKVLNNGQDSLINLLSDSTKSAQFEDRAYTLFFRYATSLQVFNSTDRTITQMISSGNLRLIENQRVADSISNYYDKVKDVGTQTALNNVAADDCFQYAQNIFRFQYGLKPHAANKKLISNQPEVLLKYINKLTEMRISEQYYAQADLKELRKNCINLIRFLRAEYK